ncbi:farnesyl-diphosphate synthase [Bacillus solimangrovi]|uniref:Farnesyl diphosphate synthase n=2 Tax=Bacillus solimangrovi TaxID=1305675 RepID=A0A1E5LKF2_9BACI|nr:farnesyl diphosphate synthase [Bacillus solimangrovi]OEH94567.1 farnesyl-diphosphate synthase [Bacillus solimangrovi]
MKKSVEHLTTPKVLRDAMVYSLEAGGKRLRPILLLETLRSFGGEWQLGMDTACAIEFIHTYSLIHDDLPSMDDDDLRRGKPTNHKVFGEANAILAGDALLTYSFQLIAGSTYPNFSPNKKLSIMNELAQSAGAEGMVGGQVADIEAEGTSIDLEQLQFIHDHKTGKLLQFCVRAGAILGDATEKQLSSLTQFATHLGIAFQIRDDILDIEGDEAKIGKPVGSDTTLQKSTYPKLLTLEGAKQKCEEHLALSLKALREASVSSERLEELARFIIQREY